MPISLARKRECVAFRLVAESVDGRFGNSYVISNRHQAILEVEDLPRKKLIHLIFANYSTLHGIQTGADVPLGPV